jgi:hypothetical protein
MAGILEHEQEPLGRQERTFGIIDWFVVVVVLVFLFNTGFFAARHS